MSALVLLVLGLVLRVDVIPASPVLRRTARPTVELYAPGSASLSTGMAVLFEDRCQEPLAELRSRPRPDSTSRGRVWCGQRARWMGGISMGSREPGPSRQLWIYIGLEDGTRGWLQVSSNAPEGLEERVSLEWVLCEDG